MAADDSTRQFLTVLTQNEALLKQTTGHFFAQSLQGLLLYPGFEELVLTVAERMADLALASTDRSAGLYDGELVGLAVTLQRSPAGMRERAMTLYERLLDNAVYGAEEAAASALRR